LTANQKKALKNKKNKMLKKIKDQIETDDVDEEGAQRIAEQWVNIADIDGDGLIDFKEFKEFVNKLDGGDDAPSEEDL
jgi:Ca2+-binding EF-hand superfamily protein|tara:strand:+ start:801 stop:1034 length:234 start_codon:yes stop_codon:yes gene_type:complete